MSKLVIPIKGPRKIFYSDLKFGNHSPRPSVSGYKFKLYTFFITAKDKITESVLRHYVFIRKLKMCEETKIRSHLLCPAF